MPNNKKISPLLILLMLTLAFNTFASKRECGTWSNWLQTLVDTGQTYTVSDPSYITKARYKFLTNPKSRSGTVGVARGWFTENLREKV